MKIVHLSTNDFGGAYKAAERISEAIKSLEIESEVYVRTKTRKNTNCKELFINPYFKIISKLKNGLNLLFSNHDIQSDFWGIKLNRFDAILSADIIFIHWTNSFVSYSGLESLLSLDKPVVFVLHDMWTFTGGCHVDGYCGKYESACISCPLMNRRLFGRHIPNINFRIKKRLISSNTRSAFVGPSRWLVDEARKSPIFENKAVEVIPNPIDTNVFCENGGINYLRLEYEIPEDKILVLFGAMSVDKVKNKGFDYFLDIIKKIDSKKYVIFVFGNDEVIDVSLYNVEIHVLGMIDSETILSKIYSSADVFVSTSRQESFGYTVCESMACGTPVVTFDIGGYKDQILHKKNGYLATPFDVDDILRGISFFSQREKKDLVSIRKRIEENNSYHIIGMRYYELVCKLNDSI